MSMRTDVDNRDPREIAAEHFTCDCSERRLTIFTDSMRRPHCRMQCVRCGAGVGVKMADFSQADINAAPPFDHSIADRWRNQKYDYGRAIHQERRARALEAFREEEAQFTEDSPEWQEMRRLVFERAGNVCEGCRKRRPTQVHHKSYARKFGREMLFDLVAICRDCHESIHDPNDLRMP